MTIFFADDAGDLGPRYANTNMSSPVKDTPPTFAEQQMLEKQRRYSQLLEDEGAVDYLGGARGTMRPKTRAASVRDCCRSVAFACRIAARVG